MCIQPTGGRYALFTPRLPSGSIAVCGVGKYLHRAQRETSTSPIMTGTSMRGPITAANAAPLSIPNVATATAIASSKLLEAAVNVMGWTAPY